MKTTPRAKSTTANPDQNIARLKEVPEQTREDIDTFLRVISFKTSFVLQPERLLELKLYIARAMAKDRSLRVPLTIEQIELEELQKWPNEIDQQRAQLDEVSRILEQSYIQTGFKQGGYKTKKVGPFFSMGDILHDPVIWSPFNFPPGTLFALREVMQGEKGFPRVPNLSDSSGLLIKPFERLGVTPVSDAFGSRKLHVADVNVATMLEESQVNFLQDPTPAEITPKQVSEWGAAGVTNLAPPAILSNLAQEQADRYWKVPNLGSSTMKQEDKDLIVREFKGSRSNTWESYCQALWKIAEKVMENRARRGDFVAEGKSTDEVLQAIMGEVAFHVKEVGVVPSSQVNLVSAMLYWVKNVTAATNEDPTVNQIYDRNYLRLAYDFIDWCGDHGLYTIENGDGTLADFEDLAASEGLSDSDLADLDDDPLVRNSRIKLYTPYVFPVRLSANTSSIGAPIEKKCERGKGNADEIRITKIRKRILSHRLQEIFDLLHGKSYDSWQIYLWLSSLQTMAAAMQEQNAGFSWLNLDDGQAAAFRRDIIGHASYRYILNYVGGQLVFFKKYLDGELEQYIQPAPLNKDEKWHPLNRWRFYLEIMYVLSLYFSRTILGVYKRADGVIDEVMPALVGMEDTNAIARIVEAINQEPDYQGDVAKNTENSKSAIRAALGAQPPAWYSLLLALFDRRVQQEKRLLENPSARSSSAASGGAPGYFDRLTADLMPFMTKHIRHLFALRFFFRSHFVPFPPDLQDYLPPSLLRADLTTDHLQNLSNSEARSKISRSSLFSGSKVRVLAIEPDEIKTNIQKCMVDPLQFGDSLGELTADVQAILKSNRFRDEFKAMIPRAAKRVEKRRLANTVYKFGIITAMMAQGNGPAAELNCRLDQLKDIGDAYQSQVQESQAVNRNIVTALATFFPTSYLILANFAFGATLPHGGVSIIQGANKEIASYDGDLIKTGTRMFRNLFDSGENEASGKKAGEGGNEGGPERQGEASGEKSQSSEAPNAGSFPYKLGKNMNRSLLRNRMKNWYTTLAAGFRPSAPNPEQVNAGESAPGENLEGTPKYTPELDLLGWAKSKGLLLYFQSEAFITSLPVFETNWGDLPRTVTTALPEDTRQYLKDQSTLYPSLLRVDLPDFGKQPPKEERGGEPSNNPSEGEPKAPESPEKKPDQASLRSRLLSAVMKALIVAAEVEGGDMLVSANTKIKLLRMVYALDFLSAQKENENISPAFKAGFDFLAELPAILPDSGFAEAIGWLVSDIVNNDWVKQTSLDIPLEPASAGQPEKGGEVRNPVEFLEEQVEELENPGKPAEGGEEGENPTSKITSYLEAEENRTEGFQATRTNYSDAVELIFSVLSCYLALADSQNAAETLKTFIGSAETSWLKRVKALKAGEQLPLKADDPFKALLDGTSSNFSEDAGKILATIKGTPPSPEETETTGASIQSPSSSRVRPLPLYLSSSKVTLGKISAMNDITSRLRSGGGFDSEVYALDEDVVTTAFATYGLDSSDVDSYTAFTMTPTKECGIPFKIDLPPLGSDDLEATNQEWGALGYLVRLLPEVDFAIADPVPWNPPSDRDKWIQRYQNDQAGAQAEMDKIIDKMHRMRNYKLDLKHFLSNRKEIVLRTLKWGLSSNRGLTEILQGINLALDEALMVQLIASAKQSKTGKTRLSEIDRITKLVSDWAGASNLEEIDKSLRLDTRFPANSPDPDNKLRQSPGGRLALYFYGGDGASRAEEMEKDLGIKVKTWDDTDLDNVDFGAVEGRGTQLVGLLKAKLSHEGFKLRERRAKRDFCLRKIAYLQRGGAIDALKHPGEFGGATPTNKLTRAERRHLFRVALEYLKRQPWFVAYVCGNIFPCEVVVPPRVFSKLKESAQANVFSLLIFPPRLPSRNVHAAVGIVGPKSVVRRPPSWATLIPRSDVVPDLILSFDLNRLSCPRTGAFRLNQLAEGALLSVPLDVPLASRALDFDHNGTPPGLVDPPLDDWALLANVFDVKRGQPLVNQAPSGENLPVAANFRHKVRVGAFLPPDADYKSVTDEAIYTTCPSDDRPFDIEARKIVLTFSDEIGALFAYWGAKQTHLWRHKVTCLRKMWKIRKQAQGQAKDLDLSRWSQEPRSKWLRLASEVSSLNRRVTSLRKAIVEYFKRLLYYLVARSGADFIAYENLSFKSGKNPQGDLSRVVALMIKDPTLIFAQLRDFMKQENLPFPKLGGVSPSYTSRVCDSCARLGIESEVDRSASYDFSPCDSCTSILDDHCNSADNIGTRLGKKLIKQRTEEEKEEKPAGESEEEPSPKKGPMLNEEKPEAKKAQRPLAGE